VKAAGGDSVNASSALSKHPVPQPTRQRNLESTPDSPAADACLPTCLLTATSACAKRDQIAVLAHPRHRRGWWSFLGHDGLAKGRPPARRANSRPCVPCEPQIHAGTNGTVQTRPVANCAGGVRMLSDFGGAVCADIRAPLCFAQGLRHGWVGNTTRHRCRRHQRRSEGGQLCSSNCVGTCFVGKRQFHPSVCPWTATGWQTALWCDKLALKIILSICREAPRVNPRPEGS